MREISDRVDYSDNIYHPRWRRLRKVLEREQDESDLLPFSMPLASQMMLGRAYRRINRAATNACLGILDAVGQGPKAFNQEIEDEHKRTWG